MATVNLFSVISSGHQNGKVGTGPRVVGKASLAKWPHCSGVFGHSGAGLKGPKSKAAWANARQIQKNQNQKNNSRDSHVVTHHITNLPACG